MRATEARELKAKGYAPVPRSHPQRGRTVASALVTAVPPGTRPKGGASIQGASAPTWHAESTLGNGPGLWAPGRRAIQGATEESGSLKGGSSAIGSVVVLGPALWKRESPALGTARSGLALRCRDDAELLLGTLEGPHGDPCFEGGFLNRS